VSSFQANGLQYFSPDHVLWTNFAENHGDVHPSLEDYFLSKWRLLERCQRSTFVGEELPDWARRFGRSLPVRATICPRWEGNLCCEALRLAHQRENFALVRALGLSLGWEESAIGEGMAEFCPPPYRLFRPAVAGNLELWNDSKATSSLAVRRALEHVKRPGVRVLWITCGSPKGERWENFLPIVQAVDRVVCFGGVGERMTALAGPRKATFLKNAKNLFPLLRSLADGGAEPVAVLFSPGFASFDAFANYAERGRWFDEGVAEVFGGQPGSRNP
jgi:UDP-N-acetylmuramoylalanine--D-glutamate ligase